VFCVQNIPQACPAFSSEAPLPDRYWPGSLDLCGMTQVRSQDFTSSSISQDGLMLTQKVLQAKPRKNSMNSSPVAHLSEIYIFYDFDKKALSIQARVCRNASRERSEDSIYRIELNSLIVDRRDLEYNP